MTAFRIVGSISVVVTLVALRGNAIPEDESLAAPCDRLGSLSSVPSPDSAINPAAWLRASSYAHGALLGAAFPTAVDPFGATGRPAMTGQLGAGQMCLAAAVIGTVGPVWFVQFLADFHVGEGPIGKHEVFVAIGPDDGIFLLGQDTVVSVGFRNRPNLDRLSAVLERYGLAGSGPQAPAERLKVARLVIGGGRSAGTAYRHCGPNGVLVTIANAYDTSSTQLEFGPTGRIDRVAAGSSAGCD